MSALVIGVPTEIKDNENRVSMQPDGVAELVHHGHQVVVQAGAGNGSRFADAEFAAAVGGQMQVGEQLLALAEAVVLRRDRLLDLDDQVGRGEHLVRTGDDLGARRQTISAWKAIMIAIITRTSPNPPSSLMCRK